MPKYLRLRVVEAVDIKKCLRSWIFRQNKLYLILVTINKQCQLFRLKRFGNVKLLLQENRLQNGQILSVQTVFDSSIPLRFYDLTSTLGPGLRDFEFQFLYNGM